MADIEARAEAEAAHKGLTGQARRSYIGGVWHRIRQAHAKATQPGGHAVPKKLFNRRARQQAREDARNAMRPHQEAIANIKKSRDWRLGRHRDEPKPAARESIADMQRRANQERMAHFAEQSRQAYAAGENQGQKRLSYLEDIVIPMRERHIKEGDNVAFNKRELARDRAEATKTRKYIAERMRELGMEPSPAAPAPPAAAPAPKAAPRPAAKRQPQGFPKPLTPIKPLPGFQLDATRRLDPYFIREYFGDAQLPEALSRQTPNNLHEAIEVIQEKTGKRYSGARSAPAMRAWILANM